MLPLNLLGLVLNFVGALLIAFSVIKNPGQAHQLVNGKRLYLASIVLNKFRWGISLFILGFFIQLVALFLGNRIW